MTTTIQREADGSIPTPNLDYLMRRQGVEPERGDQRVDAALLIAEDAARSLRLADRRAPTVAR